MIGIYPLSFKMKRQQEKLHNLLDIKIPSY